MIVVSHHRHGQRRVPSSVGPSRRGERGVIGGMEVLPFGLLVFVVGSLIILNGWAVVDAKLTASSAAREAARTYVESPAPADGNPNGAPFTAATRAAREVVANYGHNPNRLTLELLNPSFARCHPITMRANFTIHTISMPFVGGFGGNMTVHAEHREIVDPLRSGLSVEGSECYGN